MAKISVCVATFNGEKYIREQIDSILMQLGEFDELIISDDHSIDRTVDIIKEINDSRISVKFNTLTRGYTNNFESAIGRASGDIIFLSDQDDVWLSGKVKSMEKLLENYDFVVSNANFTDKDLRFTGKTFFSLRGGKKGFLNNLYKSRYLGACMAFRRSLLAKLLPFPSRKSLCPHDLWITLIAEFYFSVKVVSEPLILYRRHCNSVSDGGVGRGNGLFRKILFRMYSLVMVISRINS